MHCSERRHARRSCGIVRSMSAVADWPRATRLAACVVTTGGGHRGGALVLRLVCLRSLQGTRTKLDAKLLSAQGILGRAHCYGRGS